MSFVKNVYNGYQTIEHNSSFTINSLLTQKKNFRLSTKSRDLERNEV